MAVIEKLPHLGGMWSLWPPGNAARGLNLAESDAVTAGLILSSLLLRPDEAPIHYALAQAPDLFEPLSGHQPQYWAHNAATHIERWVSGLERLQIWIDKQPDRANRLHAFIAFRSVGRPDDSLLTFDWLNYDGIRTGDGLTPFMDSVSLNGQDFSSESLPISTFQGFE